MATFISSPTSAAWSVQPREHQVCSVWSQGADETRRLLYRLNPNKYRSGVMLPRRYTSMYRCSLYQGAHPYFLCPLWFHFLLFTFFPVNFGRNFEARVFLVPIWGLMADVILSYLQCPCYRVTPRHQELSPPPPDLATEEETMEGLPRMM